MFVLCKALLPVSINRYPSINLGTLVHHAGNGDFSVWGHQRSLWWVLGTDRYFAAKGTREWRSWQNLWLHCMDVLVIGGFGGTTIIHMQVGNHSSLPFCDIFRLKRSIETWNGIEALDGSIVIAESKIGKR